MKLSIIISVLNSHEIVRRQIIHFQNMKLPNDVEIILIDDGSNPPLWINSGEGLSPQIWNGIIDLSLQNFRLLTTNDFRPWTVELARNLGARISKGEYLLMTDIDYIVPKNAIEDALNLKEDKMRFKREFGVLDENGNFTQDHDVLRSYGLLEDRITVRRLKLSPHPNNFVMRKETFWKLGGYREDLVNKEYPNKGDSYFKMAWSKAYEKGEVTMCEYRPTIYMFPNGQFCGDVDYNPFGLFHNLTRKTKSNYWYEHLSNQMSKSVSN